MSNKPALGNRLRSLRKERNLTQREVAGLAGILVNAVSLIERDEISPSVSTLQSLATALKVRMSYFFDEDVRTDVIHLSATARPTLTSNGIIIESAGRRIQNQQIEPFLVTLAPDSGSGRQSVVHSGHEFVYCLQGTIEYDIDNSGYLLQAGDILLFEATLPHHWHNPTSGEAKMLLILETSGEHPEPVRRHFPAHPSLSHIE
jgi:transcriptional regulator with XRE-family HTH domain